MGCEDQGARYLSRPGALVEGTFRQDQRLALAVADGHRADPLGHQPMGAAVPDRSGAVRAMERGEWQAAQDADSMGEAGQGSVGEADGMPDEGRQAILQTKRWLPNRELVIVGDSGFAALDLLAAVRGHVRVITRLRLDANLFKPAPARKRNQRGRPPLKGSALPKLSTVLKNAKTKWTTAIVPQWYGDQQRTLQTATGTAVWYHSGMAPVPIRWVLVRDPLGEHEPQAFLSTDLDVTAETILQWFVFRWRVETTFQEVRTHLGVETQRQWSDLAILRTTPVLLGLFSMITVWASALTASDKSLLRPNSAAWYDKKEPTFSDAIAAVRRVLWSPPDLTMSRPMTDAITIPIRLLNRLVQTLSLAA